MFFEPVSDDLKWAYEIGEDSVTKDIHNRVLYTEELYGLVRLLYIIRILQLCLFIYVAFSDYDTESMPVKTSRPKLVHHLMQNHVMKILYNDAFSSSDCIVFI